MSFASWDGPRGRCDVCGQADDSGRDRHPGCREKSAEEMLESAERAWAIKPVTEALMGLPSDRIKAIIPCLLDAIRGTPSPSPSPSPAPAGPGAKYTMTPTGWRQLVGFTTVDAAVLIEHARLAAALEAARAASPEIVTHAEADAAQALETHEAEHSDLFARVAAAQEATPYGDPIPGIPRVGMKMTPA